MSGLKIFFNFLGRVLISGFFFVSAFSKILNWQESEKWLISVFSDWHTSSAMQNFFSFLIDWTPAVLICILVVELVGALSILLGVKCRFGAFLLMLFFIPSTILFHNFWAFEGIQRQIEFSMFLKNCAILGGLFYVLAHGKGEKKAAFQTVTEEK